MHVGGPLPGPVEICAFRSEFRRRARHLVAPEARWVAGPGRFGARLASLGVCAPCATLAAFPLAPADAWAAAARWVLRLKGLAAADAESLLAEGSQ
eukprot:957891-Alexandrium_andersonii.AAC.1